MSWHHVIPRIVLRDCFNLLLDQHMAQDWPEARKALRQFLSLVRREWPDLDQLLDSMRADTRPRASHTPWRPLDYVQDIMPLHAAVIWPAWNIVQGPSSRSDNPGSGIFDRFQYGLTAPQPYRMRAIEGLFPRLKDFCASGPAPNRGALAILAEAVSNARPQVYDDRPVPFLPAMWVKENGGLWHKRGAADPPA
ncbi:MAG: hypothetical protein ABI759_05495 [Candidatus Solibacter sp.]